MKTRLFSLFLFLSTLAAAQTYTESVLYTFTSTDGTYPVGLAIDSKGTLYGTTQYGGYQSGVCNQGGCGTIFKLVGGKETILHQFTAGTDGALPNAAVTVDKSGNIYGTTIFGGLGYGVVFKLTAAGKYSILHTFGKTTSDGKYPLGPVTLDSAGNLYGTTSDFNVCDSECPAVKDAGFGMIWKLSPSGAETILYAFGDNGNPTANVIRDGQGNLYGGAFAGNSTATAFYGGALFKVPAKGQESTLYAFCSMADCADGVDPSYTVRDSKGNFYTEVQGAGTSLQGAIAKVTPAGVETLLYQFCVLTSCMDGGVTSGPLLISGGNLYGTAVDGGTYTSGVVWELTPNGTETVVYSFGGFAGDAVNPRSGVVSDSTGNLYGIAQGGTNGAGAVFKLTKN